jgi:hypothetical protein
MACFTRKYGHPDLLHFNPCRGDYLGLFINRVINWLLIVIGPMQYQWSGRDVKFKPNENLPLTLLSTGRYINDVITSSSSSDATVHDEPWPLLRLFSLRPAAIVINFLKIKAFYGVGPSTPRQTPNLEGQGIPFCLDHHLWPDRHGRPYQQLRYGRHSSQDPQAPPLRHSIGGCNYWLLIGLNCKQHVNKMQDRLPKLEHAYLYSKTVLRITTSMTNSVTVPGNFSLLFVMKFWES